VCTFDPFGLTAAWIVIARLVSSAKIAGLWWKFPYGPPVVSADMGSFDSVRLAPHFAQDDRIGKGEKMLGSEDRDCLVGGLAVVELSASPRFSVLKSI
jgi:hypothetical protein